MTTKRELIATAFEEIGMAEYIFDATPEELQSAFRRLQTMAAEWDGMGIRVGYSLAGDIDSECGLPDTAENCYAVNLGCRMAPGYGKSVSADTKVNAKNAFNALLVSMRRRPEIPYPNRLPIGTGNKRSVIDAQYFPPPGDEVPGLNDGVTEY